MLKNINMFKSNIETKKTTELTDIRNCMRGCLSFFKQGNFIKQLILCNKGRNEMDDEE